MLARLLRPRTPRHLGRLVSPWFHGSEVAYYMPLNDGRFSVEHWGFGSYRDTLHGRATVETEQQARDFIAIGGRVPVRTSQPRRIKRAA
jgi:hypothetical protein